MVLYYSDERKDHFSSTNGCSGCDGFGYIEVEVQGYVLDTGVSNTVPIALYWNKANVDNVVCLSLCIM